jgi:hypothetical protein
MNRTIEAMPNDMLYHVCTLVLRDRRSMTWVKDWLRDNGYPAANREWPRQILARAFERRLLEMPVREHFELGIRLNLSTGTLCRVAAVDDGNHSAFEAVAELAADQVLYLIRQVHEAGQDMDPAPEWVHIGLAAGGTSRAFATHLARKLRSEHNLPKLCLHTLTSGFFVDNPDSAPLVSLGQFNDIEPRVRFVVLFSAPLVSPQEAKELPKRPFTRDAFNEAEKLDIVVTSVSVAGHGHSLFQRAVEQEDPTRAEQRLSALQQKGWAGDIMWQPYSGRGQLIDTEVRAVSVVNFADLVRLSNDPAKHVVCIAGPCADCGQPKHEAVAPLMRCPKTRRPFDHFVTTESTARKLCELLEG